MRYLPSLVRGRSMRAFEFRSAAPIFAGPRRKATGGRAATEDAPLGFDDVYARSLGDPEAFWAEAAEPKDEVLRTKDEWRQS